MLTNIELLKILNHESSIYAQVTETTFWNLMLPLNQHRPFSRECAPVEFNIIFHYENIRRPGKLNTVKHDKT